MEFERLREHIGHRIVCVIYGDVEVSLECEDCHEVLYSVNKNVRTRVSIASTKMMSIRR